MSFGFHDYKQSVRDALLEATMYNKLVFAASSNSGTRRQMAFPAWFSVVISINSANADGLPSSFNPPVPRGTPDKGYTMLGENVESAWIPGQSDATSASMCTRRMSGTSVATPIAAAVVSLLLEVAMNPGERAARDIFDIYLPFMRTYDGMTMILHKASEKTNDYRNIMPRMLFPGADTDMDRLKIAYWVEDALGVYGSGKNLARQKDRGRPTFSSSVSIVVDIADPKHARHPVNASAPSTAVRFSSRDQLLF